MKYVEIAVPKRGVGCSYCGMKIEAGIKYILTSEFIPTAPYPIKKKICMNCIGERVSLIGVLEELLRKLKLMKTEIEKI